MNAWERAHFSTIIHYHSTGDEQELITFNHTLGREGMIYIYQQQKSNPSGRDQCILSDYNAYLPKKRCFHLSTFFRNVTLVYIKGTDKEYFLLFFCESYIGWRIPSQCMIPKLYVYIQAICLMNLLCFSTKTWSAMNVRQIHMFLYDYCRKKIILFFYLCNQFSCAMQGASENYNFIVCKVERHRQLLGTTPSCPCIYVRVRYHYRLL
jgi:hypothetical protein